MFRKNILVIGAGLTLIGAGGVFFGGHALSAANSGPRTPVIVELFTSEGCSSCPPADDVLAHLEKTQPIPGAEIIVLGQHVDYWNHLGWSDPYSSHDFSVRQGEYATAFHTDQVYTPQMVVDGKTQFVGSDENAADSAIRNAAAKPKAMVSLTRSPDSTPDRQSFTTTVSSWGAEKPHGDTDVFLAVTEDNLQTQVGDGENSGRLLRHVGVVRALRLIGSVTAQNTPQTISAEFTPPSAWKRYDLHYIVFVQSRENRHILGAASVQ